MKKFVKIIIFDRVNHKIFILLVKIEETDEVDEP